MSTKYLIKNKLMFVSSALSTALALAAVTKADACTCRHLDQVRDRSVIFVIVCQPNVKVTRVFTQAYTDSKFSATSLANEECRYEC